MSIVIYYIYIKYFIMSPTHGDVSKLYNMEKPYTSYIALYNTHLT